ncbi:MAG: serine O-acetyltransferase [Eisenbergiella sp.]
MKKQMILQKLFWFKVWIADIIYCRSINKRVIDEDLERYLDETPYEKTSMKALNYCLLFNKPFRSIFYYRTEDQGGLRNISKLILKPIDTIEIIGRNIEGGLRIDHNYCVIRVERAGRNLTVRNGVTLGKGKERDKHIHPILGENVDIYANAVIFGGIHIGDNVKIGAGAIINQNVPDNATAVGNPMRIIQKDESESRT